MKRRARAVKTSPRRGRILPGMRVDTMRSGRSVLGMSRENVHMSRGVTFSDTVSQRVTSRGEEVSSCQCQRLISTLPHYIS
eukprot:1314494-Amorphochlora_amoeboformis.AAC.1